MDAIDFRKDQYCQMSIIRNGMETGYIEIEYGKITTTGFIGENTYNNFEELINGLRGHEIKIDEFYF